MVVAMLLIPMVDGIAKFLSGDLSPVYISWLRYLAGTIVVLPVAFATGGVRVPRHGLPSQVLRTVFLVTAMTLFFIALSRVPLATAVGAYFVAPIVATVLAALVLRESVTRAGVFAVGIGFAGALLILRPGFHMDTDVLYALGAGFMFACYIVASRRAALSSPPVSAIAFQYLLGTLLLTPLAVFFWELPAVATIKFIAMMGLISVSGHLLSINAFRFANASTLSPLVYVELIGTTTIGFAFFNELPGPVTWAGIACIVVAGLALYRR